MKDFHFVQGKSDLFETAFNYLKNEYLEPEDKEVIQNYIDKMKEKSKYMNFLEEQAKE